MQNCEYSSFSHSSVSYKIMILKLCQTIRKIQENFKKCIYKKQRKAGIGKKTTDGHFARMANACANISTGPPCHSSMVLTLTHHLHRYPKLVGNLSFCVSSSWLERSERYRSFIFPIDCAFEHIYFLYSWTALLRSNDLHRPSVNVCNLRSLDRCKHQ